MDYYASGKLLFFGEYLVLKGAKALAIPLKFGQHLSVQPLAVKKITWISYVKGEKWFSAEFSPEGELEATTDKAAGQTLSGLFQMIKNDKPGLFNSGYAFQSNANFPLEWGLGSSSTLISLLAQWSQVDPFMLLEHSFGGSGYDVACAKSSGPILFEKQNKTSKPVSLSPAVTSKLLFIFSGKKQKSRSEVIKFDQVPLSATDIETMNRIVQQAVSAKYIGEWELLMDESELLLGKILEKKPLKNFTFPEYPFSIKSLGAWGGDFFMATYRNKKDAREYFSQKGYEVLFTYDQIIKK